MPSSSDAHASQSFSARNETPARENLFVVGVTGVIGSGKSTFARLLADVLRADIIDADALGKRALAERTHDVFACFGDLVRDERGAFNKGMLRDLVFSDEHALRTLEGILHPRMRKMAEEILASTKEGFVVIDAAVLFRMGFDAFCDHVVYVHAEEDAIISRVRGRDALDEAEVRHVLAKQKDIKLSRNRSDTLIVNNGEKAELLRAAEKVGNELCTTLKTSTMK